MPDGVFISYRHQDVSRDVRGIYERLRAELGPSTVFMDKEGLEPGDDFIESIDRQLARCQVLLAIIGPKWLDAKDDRGHRRLDDEEDFVRYELRTALQRNIKVIPVLLDGAAMPTASDLPDDLRPITRRQALLFHSARFSTDIIGLTESVRRILARAKDPNAQDSGLGDLQHPTVEAFRPAQTPIARDPPPAGATTDEPTSNQSTRGGQSAPVHPSAHSTDQGETKPVEAKTQTFTATASAERTSSPDGSGQIEKPPPVTASDTNLPPPPADLTEPAEREVDNSLQQLQASAVQAIRTASDGTSPEHPPAPPAPPPSVRPLLAEPPWKDGTTATGSDSDRNARKWLGPAAVATVGAIGILIFLLRSEQDVNASNGAHPPVSPKPASASNPVLQPAVAVPNSTAASIASVAKPAEANPTGDNSSETSIASPVPTVQRTACTLNAETSRTPSTPFRDCIEEHFPKLVIVPSGKFLMGSSERDNKGTDRERPEHEVSVTSFAIGIHEVSFEQWDQCVRAKACRPAKSSPGKPRGNYPVVDVDWEDAQSYIRWLSAETKKRYRLPTEAEWEYAARAAPSPAEKTSYAFGETLEPSLSNFSPGSGRSEAAKVLGTRPVGLGAVNRWGIFHMHGNVWEWVQDCWHRNYQNAPSHSRNWTKDCDKDDVYGVRRIVRGGSWRTDMDKARSAYRWPLPRSQSRRDDIGFRVARDVTRN